MPDDGKGKMAENRIPYFRFYPSDFMRGIRGLSAQEAGIYVMLLCRMYEESGPLENHALRLSTYCGMRLATFEKTLDRLVALGKITVTDGMLFNDRAAIEISNRADDLKIASKAGKASAEKRQQNQGIEATPVQRPFNHTDTDTKEDKREAKASQKNTRGSRLSAEWFLPIEWGEWAVSEGLGHEAIRGEADKFKDYWTARAGPQGVKLDWNATWRNWIRTAKERGHGNRSSKQIPNGGKRPDAALANIARLAGLGQASGDGGLGVGGFVEEDGPFRMGSGYGKRGA